MNSFIDIDKDFKEAIGGFVIEFSLLEFNLAELCLLTKEKVIINYLELNLSEKREEVKNIIKKRAPKLEDKWNIINSKIGMLNEERRYIVHGFINYSLSEKQKTFVPKKNIIKNQIFTVKKINKMTKEIMELNTGKNGLGGSFYIEFKNSL